jgi:hypothetical protein
LIAIENGLMKGYPDKTLKPEQKITRAEMCMALMNAFPAQATDTSIPTFKDKEDIPEWAKVSIEKALRSKIVTGYTDNTFKAGAYTTRAESFTMICKLKGYHTEHVSGAH